MNNYQRAKLVVQQIKDGEWTPEYNDIGNEYYTIVRRVLYYGQLMEVPLVNSINQGG